MQWTEGNIEGALVCKLDKHADDRGWLSEMFRQDEVAEEIMPAMGYISMTVPGASRGPHEHVEQTDYFCFTGPGNFRVKLWDTREDSSTYGVMFVLEAGEDNPTSLVVPPRVVHGYTNISDRDAVVMNFPNRLFAGAGKKEEIDEIRHEESGDCNFSMD